MAERPDAVPYTLHVFAMHLLGSFQFTRDDKPVTFPTRKIESLLAYLALTRGTAHSRQQLAFLLYPDSSDAQARTNLRNLLHRLRTALPEIDLFVEADTHSVSWKENAPVWVDLFEFQNAIARADQAEKHSECEIALAMLEGAATLYRGELVPDCYNDWILPERERLHRSIVQVLERSAQFYEESRDYSTAIARANRLLALEPLDETAYLILLRCHAALGERGAALRIYHICLTAFRQELDAEPSPALRDAYTRLLSASFESVPTLTPQAPLVGRSAEWQHLVALWTRTASSPPRLLLMMGEAGIGKTRLAEEFLVWARHQGVTTAVAACYASENTLPYAPVLAWLRTPQIAREWKRMEPAWLKEILPVLPEIRGDQPDWTEQLVVHPAWQRQRLFEALARALLAGTQPLLLLIDDLQWGDSDTLQWLHFLLHFAGARVLVLATVRSEELDQNSALVALRDDLRHADRLSEIALGTLSRHDTLQLAQHLSTQPLEEVQMEQLYAETEGNPLFVVEMVRAGIVAEDKPPAKGSRYTSPKLLLPPKVRAVIERRLSHISPAARQVMDTAAVIGRSFTFEVLERAIKDNEESVVTGLDELWRRHIVRETHSVADAGAGTGEEGYDFAHDKLRAVAYADLSATRRRFLHRHVARALESVHGANLDAIAAQLAWHHERAGESEPAITMYRRAADASIRLYANADALENLDRARELLDRADVKLPAHERQRVVGEISAQRGDLLFMMGHYDEARTAFEDALSRMNESDENARGELYRKLGNCWRELHRYPEALAAYDTSEDMLPTINSDSPSGHTRIEVEIERFSVYYWLADLAAIRDLLARLEPLIAQHATPQQRARFYQIQAAGTLRVERYVAPQEAVNAAQKFLAMIQAEGNSFWLQSAHFQLGFVLLWHGDLEEAEREMLAALDVANARGDVSLIARCLTYLTVVHRLRGNVEQVRAYAQESLEFAKREQMPDYVGAAHGNLAWLAWRENDLQKTLAQGQAAQAAWRSLPNVYMFQWIALVPLLAASLELNKLDLALEVAGTLLEDSQQRMPDAPEDLFTRAIAAAGDSDLAAARMFLKRSLVPARDLNFL